MNKISRLIIILISVFILSSCTKELTNYNVTFDSNGGTALESITINEDTSLVLPTDPTKEGYTFEGWYYEEDLDTSFNKNDSINEDVTFYAKWTPIKTIMEFLDYDGTLLQTNTYDYGTELTVDDSPSVDYREGYSFSGWDTEFPVTVDGTMKSIIAVYEINQYTVTFDSNGGSSVDSITDDYNEVIEMPEFPVLEGYTFIAWYKDIDLTKVYVFSTVEAKDITLYAKWEIVDTSDVKNHLASIIPNSISSDIELPKAYLDYTISWSSSDYKIISKNGTYSRPYHSTVIVLTATITKGSLSITQTYNLSTTSYKSLDAPVASSYIYRDYNDVTDSFFTTLDIINCAFITADSNGELSGRSVLNNINTYIMPNAKENGNWVLFSVAPSSEWSDIAASDELINTFADNIVDMINEYGFDGVDIDWETPTSSESDRFVELMRVVYTKVKANNPNHLVTAAVAGGMWQPPRYDLASSHQYMDYVNMMTYGMVNNNGYYQNALYKSTTFDSQTNLVGKTLTSCSIEESIVIYNSYGIPNSKIIVGVAFYGIKQTRTYDSITDTWSDWSREGTISYDNIRDLYFNNDSYLHVFDQEAGVPYIISTDGTFFISFDDTASIILKSAYIENNNLGGIMYWENGLDSSGSLLSAIDEGINNLK